MTATAWAATAIFAGAYVLIASEKINRVTAALGGAIAMVLIGATDAHHIFFDERTGIEWNVIFLLIGMMLIVAVIKRTGAFEYVAIWSAKRAKGRPFRVMVILVLVTAVASAMLDNVTTVLLIVPVTFLVCERLDVPVVPFLIAEALASNIGGTATLVGDPPNIIIANRGGLSYNDFLIHLAPFIVVLLVVYIGLCRWMFRGAFRFDEDRAEAIAALRERDAIRDPRLLTVSLVVLGGVTAAFVLYPLLELEPSLVAMIGGLLLVAASQLDAGKIAADVEWETLIFFAGLFIMVGALVHTGVIAEISRAAVDRTEGRLWAASVVLLVGSAVLSGIVDNIPYVASMSPVVAEIVAANGEGAQGTDSTVLWWAMALGADLGGNATAVGASATVVVLGLARRAGKPISFWEFTKYGLLVTAVSIALALPYLWLRYFAF